MNKEKRRAEEKKKEELGRSYLAYFKENAADKKAKEISWAKKEEIKEQVLNKLKEQTEDKDSLLARDLTRKRRSSYLLMKRTIIPAAAVFLLSLSLVFLVKIIGGKKAQLEQALKTESDSADIWAEYSETKAADLAQEAALEALPEAAPEIAPPEMALEEEMTDFWAKDIEQPSLSAPGEDERSDDDIFGTSFAEDRILFLANLFAKLKETGWQEDELQKELWQNELESLPLQNYKREILIYANEKRDAPLDYFGYLALETVSEEDAIIGEIEDYLGSGKYSFLSLGHNIEAAGQEFLTIDKIIGEKMTELAENRALKIEDNLFIWLIWQ